MNRQSFHRTRRYRGGVLGSTAGIGAVGIAVLIALLILLRLLAPGLLGMLTTPLWRTGASLTAAVGSLNPAESKADLRVARDAALARNAELAAQNAALSARVLDLNSLLGTRVEPEKGIVAGVLSRPPVAPYDVLVVDQGTSAGVRQRARVMGAGGTPIGTVGSTDKSQSRVTLYSTRGIETSAWLGDARTPVTLTGAGAGAFTASVPKEADVQVGDGVYVSGAGAFPIGTVAEIQADPSSPFVNLNVRPYTNPFSLTWVTISRD